MSKFKYDLGIIGLGYVGLPLAVYSVDAGLKVFGYDINSEKVSKLNKGVSPIEDVSDKTLNSSIESGLIFSDDSNSLRDCEHIVISVPTPLTDFKPDLSYVISAAQEIAKNVSMQDAAMNPIALDEKGVDSSIVEKEIEIAKDQLRQEGKPEEMLDKIASGKINRFFKDNTLVNQAFIKDGKISVADYVKSTHADLIVTGFQRIALG